MDNHREFPVSILNIFFDPESLDHWMIMTFEHHKEDTIWNNFREEV